MDDYEPESQMLPYASKHSGEFPWFRNTSSSWADKNGLLMNDLILSIQIERH